MSVLNAIVFPAPRTEPDLGKWTLGSITTYKANGGDGIPVELFQILESARVPLLRGDLLSEGPKPSVGSLSFSSLPPLTSSTFFLLDLSLGAQVREAPFRSTVNSGVESLEGCLCEGQSKGLSRVFSNTTVQKHQFFCTQLSL